MANSAISTPTFQALAGSIKNADGTTAIYSGGVWTFKNSSGTTTFTVSDAGAVTAGVSAGGITHTVIGRDGLPSGGNSCLNIKNSSTGNFLLLGVSATSGYAWHSSKTSGGAAAPYVFFAGDTEIGRYSDTGAWTFPVSVSVTGTADVSGTSAALRTDGGCYVAKIMSAGTVTDRTPFPEDLQTAIDAVNSMEKLPEGEYDSANKEKQLDHSKLHPYISSGDYRDMSATVSCLALVCQNLLARLASAEARIRLLEDK